MDYIEKGGRVLDLEIFELQRLRKRLDEDFSRAVDAIKQAVEARGKVVVVGVGKSGHIGSKIAATLTSTGSPAVGPRFAQCVARRSRNDVRWRRRSRTQLKRRDG